MNRRRAGSLGVGTIVIAPAAGYFPGIDPRTLRGLAETVPAQRMRWFKTGFDAAGIDSCDTFAARES